MNQDGRRGLRIAEIARAEFARAVQRRIDDPALTTLMIASVQVSDDLQVIDFGVRFPGVDVKEQKQRVERLRKALPRLVREIVPRLKLRRAPEFRLRYDAGADASVRVEELLREIADEPKGEPGNE